MTLYKKGGAIFVLTAAPRLAEGAESRGLRLYDNGRCRAYDLTLRRASVCEIRARMDISPGSEPDGGLEITSDGKGGAFE